MRTCKKWREGKEIVCSCGYRWGEQEDDPHGNIGRYTIVKILKRLRE